MSGQGEVLEPDLDFLDQLNEKGNYLAPTFYTALGVVVTLVIVIIILLVGYCLLALFIIRRNRKAAGLSTSDEEELELDERNGTHAYAKDGGDSAQTEEGRQQKSEIVKCSEDISPVIASEKVDKVPRESQLKDSEEDNTLEDMYDTVTMDTETGNGAANDRASDARPAAASTTTTTMTFDEDYAEVLCHRDPSVKHQPQETTKSRSHTLPVTAFVLELENEDYSRLLHNSQPNPRFSMPLLSEYSHIDLHDAKQHSLEMELDQNAEQSSKLSTKGCDYETMTDPPNSSHTRLSTPPLLPTPVLDDMMELKLAPQQETSTPEATQSSQEQGRESNYEMMSEPPKTESPPPLPPPILEEEEAKAIHEVLYENPSDRFEICISPPLPPPVTKEEETKAIHEVLYENPSDHFEICISPPLSPPVMKEEEAKTIHEVLYENPSDHFEICISPPLPPPIMEEKEAKAIHEVLYEIPTDHFESCISPPLPPPIMEEEEAKPIHEILYENPNDHFHNISQRLSKDTASSGESKVAGNGSTNHSEPSMDHENENKTVMVADPVTVEDGIIYENIG